MAALQQRFRITILVDTKGIGPDVKGLDWLTQSLECGGQIPGYADSLPIASNGLSQILIAPGISQRKVATFNFFKGGLLELTPKIVSFASTSQAYVSKALWSLEGFPVDRPVNGV